MVSFKSYFICGNHINLKERLCTHVSKKYKEIQFFFSENLVKPTKNKKKYSSFFGKCHKIDKKIKRKTVLFSENDTKSTKK